MNLEIYTMFLLYFSPQMMKTVLRVWSIPNTTSVDYGSANDDLLGQQSDCSWKVKLVLTMIFFLSLSDY